MKSSDTFAFLFIFSWLAGIALAQGGLKILAFLFPPYALYLVVERFLILVHFLP